MKGAEGRHPADARPIPVSGVTLGTFVVLGVFVAFAVWGVVPRKVLVVGGPAIAAAMVLEMGLRRLLRVDLGVAAWLVVYAGLYVEALLFGFWMRWWRRQSVRRRSVE